MNDPGNSKFAPQPLGPDETHVGDLVVRRQIPGYQILKKLGSGGMAVVFKARQLSLDRIVAIKVLPKKFSADKDYVHRFYAEGKAAAKLNHPNIVQAIDVSEYAGYHYFVMEYVEGRTVFEELEAGKVYPENEALGIILQIGGALEHAHAIGLIHRDVKPKNIMITPDGTAKLMDMGLARRADDAKAIQAEAGKLYGTPYYVSPEQILGKTDIDSRCDIYALGATLYHMVTGRVPFDGKDAKEVMLKHIKQPLTPPDHYNMDLSFGLVKVIQKMMTKKRKNRYASTGKMMEDLRSIDFLLEVSEGKPDETDLAEEAEKPGPSPKPKPRTAVRPPLKPLLPATPDMPPPTLIPPRSRWYIRIALIASLLLNAVLLYLLIGR